METKKVMATKNKGLEMFTLDQIKDEFIGEEGTEKRAQYEQELQLEILDEMIYRAMSERKRTTLLMTCFAMILLPILLTACKTQQLAVVKLNDKFGCIDKKGNMVIQPLWDWILQGDKNKPILVEKDSLFGFLNNKGRIIIAPQYKEGELFSEGLAAVSNGEKYGFINVIGDTVIPFIYDDTFMGFNNQLSDVTINDSCGYINKKGEIIIPLIYETCYPFMSEYAQVETFDGESLLIDKNGITYDYDEVSEKKRLWVPRDIYPGSFTTSTGRGRMNAKGDTIIPPIYKVTGNLFDHMHIVQDKNDKWGAYNDKGKLTVVPQFESIWHFNEGVANFKLKGKWGYVNRKGEIVIDPIFDYAGQFRNGVAYVEYEGKAGFINNKGKFIIEPRFQLNEWRNNFK